MLTLALFKSLIFYLPFYFLVKKIQPNLESPYSRVLLLREIFGNNPNVKVVLNLRTILSFTFVYDHLFFQSDRNLLKFSWFSYYFSVIYILGRWNSLIIFISFILVFVSSSDHSFLLFLCFIRWFFLNFSFNFSLLLFWRKPSFLCSFGVLVLFWVPSCAFQTAPRFAMERFWLQIWRKWIQMTGLICLHCWPIFTRKLI